MPLPPTVAALYVDPLGPYPHITGVECWGLPYRDARRYEGPWPVVAHPPCGPWSKLKHLYRGTEHDCAPIAVAQVRRWGGVLEHPAQSRLWDVCSLPKPGRDDDWGGFTVSVNQVDWGHACAKPTWLYLRGVPVEAIVQREPRKPTHGIWYGRFERSGHTGPKLLGASKEIRRRTPPDFARYLVSLARSAA